MFDNENHTRAYNDVHTHRNSILNYIQRTQNIAKKRKQTTKQMKLNKYSSEIVPKHISMNIVFHSLKPKGTQRGLTHVCIGTNARKEKSDLLLFTYQK